MYAYVIARSHCMHMATREQRQDETSEVKSVADGIITVHS